LGGGSVVSLILGVRDLHLKDSMQLQFVKRESHRPISDADHRRTMVDMLRSASDSGT